MAMSVDTIIQVYAKGQLISRPEYYSGRGNNSGDLNSRLIGVVYDGIKAEIGADAAKAFVNMVGEMTDDASATTFLVALKRLERSDWVFTSQTIPTSTDAFAESISDARRRDGDDLAFAAAFGGIASIFGGMGRTAQPGDGLGIIGPFLKAHEKELDRKITPRQQDRFQYGHRW